MIKQGLECNMHCMQVYVRCWCNSAVVVYHSEVVQPVEMLFFGHTIGQIPSNSNYKGVRGLHADQKIVLIE